MTIIRIEWKITGINVYEILRPCIDFPLFIDFENNIKIFPDFFSNFLVFFSTDFLDFFSFFFSISIDWFTPRSDTRGVLVLKILCFILCSARRYPKKRNLNNNTISAYTQFQKVLRHHVHAFCSLLIWLRNFTLGLMLLLPFTTSWVS